MTELLLVLRVLFLFFISIAPLRKKVLGGGRAAGSKDVLLRSSIDRPIQGASPLPCPLGFA